MSKDNKIKKRYDRIAPVYDSLELFMEKGKMGDWRQNLWQKVSKKIDQSESVSYTHLTLPTNREV